MSISRKCFAITVELVEPMLGTVPKTEGIYEKWIQQKKDKPKLEKDKKKGLPLANGDEPTDEAIQERMDEEIEETIEDIEKKNWTGFHENPSDGKGPFVYDYFISGALRNAAQTLNTIGNVKALGSKFRKFVFLGQRRVYLGPIADHLERPIQIKGPQGPRVSITRSDMIPAGRQFSFDLAVLRGGGITENILREVIEYWEFLGFGQWRTGGWGRAKLIKFALTSTVKSSSDKDKDDED